jgi:arsenate reductase
MAEGLARSVAPKGVEIFSAGSSPSQVNLYARQVMQEIGIDLSSHYSKSVDDIPKERIGTAITLCAEEVCPILPGEVERLHWPHPDPAATVGSDEDIRAAFRRVRDQIRKRIEAFFKNRP